MAWLTEWNRRKLKIINGTIAGDQTNYQVKFTIYRGFGTDFADTVYLGYNVRNDFGDIRFTSSDETALIDYWIESYIYGVSAIVWVEIPFIPASPGYTTIYLYYDNLLATTISNGDKTFIFFDHFLKLDTKKWTILGPSSVANSEVIVGNNGVIYNDVLRGPYNLALRTRWNVRADENNYVLFHIDPIGFTGKNVGFQTSSNWMYCQSHNISSTSQKYVQTNGFNIYEIIWLSTNIYYTQEDILKINKISQIPTSSLKITLRGGSTTTYGQCIIDWVLLRKYTSPEPGYGAWGIEETPTPTMCISPICNFIVT